jgi:PhzF family phenazine biosynthesis protein
MGQAVDTTDVQIVDVFTHGGQGGNPCPVVLDAAGMTAVQMQDVARRYCHESAFVVPPEDEGHDFSFRYFVPNHEMEMCGHATIGALWLLARAGRLAGTMQRIATRSGTVIGYVGASANGGPEIAISQPAGKVTALDAASVADVCAVLGIDHADLADRPLRNAVTSRVKTLVPMKDPEHLNRLQTDMGAVEAVCRRIGSTGLYPYAILDASKAMFEARQFPRASGYPEDAATGIAAAALAFGLLHDGDVPADDRVIHVLQGRVMGCLSEIRVRIGFAGGKAIGCLLSGDVSPALGDHDV